MRSLVQVRILLSSSVLSRGIGLLVAHQVLSSTLVWVVCLLLLCEHPPPLQETFRNVPVTDFIHMPSALQASELDGLTISFSDRPV